jgi:DNA polymerase iota
VVLALDLDCFYAQVVMVSKPSLRQQPLGITQKYLVVTCNYPARAFGVGKLMAIAEARRLCPHLVLVPGERLDPFRAASQEIHDCIAAQVCEATCHHHR